MGTSRPVALGTTAISDPVRLGPYLDGGAPGSVGARRLRDMPEVWDASKPGTYALAVDTNGVVTLVVAAPVEAHSYHHVQVSAADAWTISHDLGFNPAGVVVKDSQGAIVFPATVDWPDTNTLVVTFPGRPMSGTAEVS